MNVRHALEVAVKSLHGDKANLEELYQQACQQVISQSPDATVAAVYETLQRYRLARRGDSVCVVRDPRKHRASGVYYTVEPVVTYMVSQVLRRLPGRPRVLDPAAGAGAFLTALEGRADAWGLEIDPAALNLCRAAAPSAHLQGADALVDDVPDGFDAVIGNPPYIAHGLRGAPTMDPTRRQALQERYPYAAEYKLNTYALFIERGLSLLRPDGVLAFIVPDSLLTGRYFAKLRAHLVTQASIVELNLIREDFWPHGRVGQSLILIVQKRHPDASHKVAVRICNRLEDLERPAVIIEQAKLSAGPLRRWRLIAEPVDLEVIDRVEACPTSLGQFVESYSGLIAKQGQNSLVTLDPEIPGIPVGKLLRSGRQIDRYHLEWTGEFVRLDPALIKSGGKLSKYQQPKLLLRQTADALRVVYDDQAFYCLNNTHLLIAREPDVDLMALLAVLNSSLVNRYYQLITQETGRLYPQVDLDILESIPVPDPHGEKGRKLSDLAKRRMKATADDAVALDREIDHWVEQCYLDFGR